jgi:transposase-like protein
MRFIFMSCACPQCHSKAYKRNGYTRHGKQNHRCLSCGRQFSLEPYSLNHDSNNLEPCMSHAASTMPDAVLL